VQNGLDAVEQRPDGLVHVITETARNDGGELRAVRLRVSDNGGGFGDKVMKRAFEPYVTTKPKGTGLGLAVVKKIADEHGARVRIVNRRADAPAGPDGAPGEGPVVGAQVSLSFSRFALAKPLVLGQTLHAPDMPATASPPNPAPATAPGAAQG
jgi:nitrogen fixation/metabolism regulation signal transduction histidine kinase